ncbi:MAG: adenosylcobinamide-phosphate synthase CbiB [Pseudomonadota bacterium]
MLRNPSAGTRHYDFGTATVTHADLMLAALLLEIVCGWPDWLYRRVRHPVVWLGALITRLEHHLNRQPQAAWPSRLAGVFVVVFCVGLAVGMGSIISMLLPNTIWGYAVEALVAASLLASRSLHAHVKRVLTPLMQGDLLSARASLAMLVSRDVTQLDEPGVCRGALESLAENTSDGIVAPLFWGCLFGLPGIAGYKAVNTLDSMLGYRSDRYLYFGWFAARLDDVLNWLPARLTAVLYTLCRHGRRALDVVRRDAGKHRSPNAGWPEAALAGVLNVRLSGPRCYAGRVHEEAWVNASGLNPDRNSLHLGLKVYQRVVLMIIVSLTGATIWQLN